jgi:nucleoside-diphosphate-sugar epimerase
MSAKAYLVTGGAGFLGSALVRRLVDAGQRVRVLDNQSRGALSRLAGLEGDWEFVEGDVTRPETVAAAVRGVDGVFHLAFVNGTEYFYTRPELVLEVGVKGIVNVIDACVAARIPELIVASSSEVYQTPPRVPTDERVPLTIPDPHNPRYSYAAGKILSEVMALNYGRRHFERVVIFRPHNVYGPDMGWEHVVPQFVLRMRELARGEPGVVRFPIQARARRRAPSSTSTTSPTAWCGSQSVASTSASTTSARARRSGSRSWRGWSASNSGGPSRSSPARRRLAGHRGAART